MQIEQQVALAPYSSLRVGGPADYLVRVADEAELLAALDFASGKDLPILVLGGGSNVLLPDAGWRGLVIKNEINQIEWLDSGVRAGSGTSLAQLISGAVSRGLGGLERLTGLPGTLGGAVAGNAGCYGLEIGELVRSARVCTGQSVQEVNADFFEFGYRTSRLRSQDEILIQVELALKPGDPAELRQQCGEIARLRASKQPRGATAGSFFKNPPGKKAWELIDSAGMRTAKVGDAAVSTEHANYLINLGQAKASDLLQLARQIQEAVLAHSGIELEPEVRIVTQANQS